MLWRLGEFVPDIVFSQRNTETDLFDTVIIAKSFFCVKQKTASFDNIFIVLNFNLFSPTQALCAHTHARIYIGKAARII